MSEMLEFSIELSYTLFFTKANQENSDHDQKSLIFDTTKIVSEHDQKYS